MAAPEVFTPKESLHYSSEEEVVLKRIHAIVGHDVFSSVEDAKQKSIVQSLLVLVEQIRNNDTSIDDFFAYQDAHLDDPTHAFLSEEYPGLNVAGWRVVMALIDPLRFGEKIDRPVQQIRGTISQRSAK